MVKSTGCTEVGMSDHLLVYAQIDMKYRRPPAKIITARNLKKHNLKEFQQDLLCAPWSVCHAFEDPDDVYWAWSSIFTEICDRHAPYRNFKVRSQSLP